MRGKLLQEWVEKALEVGPMLLFPEIPHSYDKVKPRASDSETMVSDQAGLEIVVAISFLVQHRPVFLDCCEEFLRQIVCCSGILGVVLEQDAALRGGLRQNLWLRNGIY